MKAVFETGMASQQYDIMLRNFDHLVRKMKDEAVTASNVARIGKVDADFWEKVTEGGKGVKEFGPIILQLMKQLR